MICKTTRYSAMWSKGFSSWCSAIAAGRRSCVHFLVRYTSRTGSVLFSSPTTATLPRTTRQLTTHPPPPRLTTSRRHSSLAPNTQLKLVIPPLLPHPPSQRIILLYLYNNHAFDQNVGKHCAKCTNNAYLVVAKRMYFI